MDDIILIDVRQCPTCTSYFEEDGPLGIVPHVLEEHPDSPLALRIRAMLPPRESQLGTSR